MTETEQQTKRPITHSLLFNLLLIGAILVLFYFIFFSALGWITGHGNEKVVPNLTGKTMKEAIKILESNGFDIDIDSTYDPTQKGLMVMQQQPDAGMTVKDGRTIFIVVNKKMPPLTPMPNLVNMSFRSAELLLKSSKLVLGDTTYRPDIASGSVLEQSLEDGSIIKAGTMIAQGTKINLVIGDGLGNSEINVPDVTGMNYQEALSLISANNLQYTVIFDGEISDTNTAVIGSQMPTAADDFGAPIKVFEGDVIDLRVQQTPSASQ